MNYDESSYYSFLDDQYAHLFESLGSSEVGSQVKRGSDIPESSLEPYSGSSSEDKRSAIGRAKVSAYYRFGRR